MKVEVSTGIEELKRQFDTSSFTVREDGQGGAYVLIEPVPLGPKYRPAATWVGFQIPAQYPYADIYPVFIGGDVARVDGVPLVAPVTPGHNFEGRAAIQVSRRSAAALGGLQKVTAKILKILDFLEKLS
ncbi:MAG TPA: hypothetical protein VNH19_01830 [Candidatus Limnocylindrales bacterium]|nr:hypothetical protein [Candidatus Limnocylindrales bacterium]